jgi:hypothetical protein
LFVLALSLALYAALTFAPSSRITAPGIPPSAAPALGDEIRILAGFMGSKMIDALGQTWWGDRYFAGGQAVERTFRRIYRTPSQALYRYARQGDFRYDIPLKAGVYELHLHFVEIIPEELDLDSGGEQSSRFRVYANGKPLLSFFDVVVDAGGPNIADERVFTDISPAEDGYLHLSFVPSVNKAHVTAIEILPGIPGRMRPVRIVAALGSVYDSKGVLWGADRYFLGGRITRRGAPVDGNSDRMLYGSERWGHFSYAIPVAAGRYRVTLRFAETFPGGVPPGNRLFDVYCNGTTLLKSFDTVAVAGGSHRGADQVFRSIPANAQGKLVLSFVPVKNYAIVNAIEVAAEE